MRTREAKNRHFQVESLEGRFALGGGSSGILALSGGEVLAPTAVVEGYSLTDMARETALFSTSGNRMKYYPTTPLQVLYYAPRTYQATFSPDGSSVTVTGGNQFIVSPNMSFYVPILNADDSPPVVGNFPKDAQKAASYFFAPGQLGVTDTKIIVDGKSTSIGAEYLVGPVRTPPLNDGGGTHFIMLGVFLSPMSAGTHTVEIQGEVAGQAFQAAYGLNSESFDFTYTVNVVNQ